MKKVLIITYYWPPSGGAGVYRNLKFAKYFRQFGWEPVIFTPENADYPVTDESLNKDVPEGISIVKNAIREPYHYYRRLRGMKKGEKIYSGFMEDKKAGGKPSFTQRISVWVRGNLFIPDARKWWIRPSVKFLIRYLRENPVDAIISSGPPHSTHMIARGVKRATGIPWIADFRDPWTNIDFYSQLKLTRWADRKHHSLEKSILKEADEIVTVSWSWAEDFDGLGAHSTKVIPNGFDEDEFYAEPASPVSFFSLTHLGSINADRSPVAFWQALRTMLDEKPEMAKDFRVRLIGPADQKVVMILKEMNLTGIVQIEPYKPHAEAVRELMRSSALLLLLNNTPNVKGVIPGKLFEYLAARKPILAIGPPSGDSARIIRETGSGEVKAFEDPNGMAAVILNWYTSWQNRTLSELKGNIDPYSRKNITGQMAGLLDKLIKRSPAS